MKLMLVYISSLLIIIFSITGIAIDNNGFLTFGGPPAPGAPGPAARKFIYSYLNRYTVVHKKKLSYKIIMFLHLIQ